MTSVHGECTECGNHTEVTAIGIEVNGEHLRNGFACAVCVVEADLINDVSITAPQ